MKYVTLLLNLLSAEKLKGFRTVLAAGIPIVLLAIDKFEPFMSPDVKQVVAEVGLMLAFVLRFVTDTPVGKK